LIWVTPRAPSDLEDGAAWAVAASTARVTKPSDLHTCHDVDGNVVR
jgi:hypothetical protein